MDKQGGGYFTNLIVMNNKKISPKGEIFLLLTRVELYD